MLPGRSAELARRAWAGAVGFVGALSFGFSMALADDAVLYGTSDPNAVRGGTLTIGSLVEPPALDPFHQAADARIQVSVLMYQGLVYEDADGVPQPLLATGWELSDDGKTYTFHLREGVVFHTGEPMTAEDVKYSYDYLRDPENGSPGAGDLAMVESIEVVDDHTVRFVLSRPNAALPITLSNKYGAVVPSGYFDDEGAQTRMNEVSVGTGPFKLTAFRPNSFLTVQRNPDYWQPDLPYLDEVTFVYLPNSASMLAALRNRRVDLVLLSRPQDAEQVTGDPNLVVERSFSYNQKSIDLNAEYEPVSDLRVRQAMALVIDKGEVLNAALGGYGQVIGTVPAGMQETWGAPIEELPFQTVDVERARELMAEAGHADGLDVDLVTIIGYDWMDPAAVTLASQLERIGINVNIQRVDLGVWIRNWRGRSFPVTLNDWGTSPDPSLLFYRHFHKQPEGNDNRNWNNDRASELLDRGQQVADYEERKAIYVEFQKLLAEEVPTIMMFSSDLVTVRQQNVHNHQQHPTGWYFGVVKTYKN
jgi:peptide/nickel transport system substrate-binding protein